jgi:hypothetical protein
VSTQRGHSVHCLRAYARSHTTSRSHRTNSCVRPLPPAPAPAPAMRAFYSFVAKSGLCVHVTYVNPALVPTPLKKFTVYITPDAGERSLARMIPLRMEAMILETESKRIVCQFANAPMLMMRFSYELADQSFMHEGSLRTYQEPVPLPMGAARSYATHACYTINEPDAQSCQPGPGKGDVAGREYVLRRVASVELVP